MNTHINLIKRTVKPWHRAEGVSVCGSGFLPDGTHLEAASFCGAVREAIVQDHLTAFLEGLNGFFAIIAEHGDSVVAVVDRVRSIPLFYGVTGDAACVSDDAEWVRQNVGDRETDEVAKQEFLLTGYVTGADTLFANVKQVQAGEAVYLRAAGAGQRVSATRWYRFLHQEPERWDESALLSKLNNHTEASHKRLIEYAAGRQIAIPLSGGYDSRLIATMLKKLGYENVIAFTYGVPGNKESEISKTIAQKLGIPWHFVEYSNERWRTWFESTERKDYYRMGSGWASLAHTQDWPAVRELKERGVLDPDAVIVPGYGGTVVGGHTPTPKDQSDVSRMDELLSLVGGKHYSLRPWRSDVQALTDWNRRIMDRAERGEISTPVELAGAFEKWEWQERQAKFIVNSVRVYDFWDFDWWMPLWDADFMRFWQGVPLELRLNKRWYAGFVAKVYGDFTGLLAEDVRKTARVERTSSGSLSKRAIVSFSAILKRSSIARLALSRIRRHRMDTHALGWAGRYSHADMDRLANGEVTATGLNVERELRELEEYLSSSNRSPIR